MTGHELANLRRSRPPVNPDRHGPAESTSQAELAAKLGVSPTTISQWERGRRAIGPAMEKLIRLTLTADR